LILIYLIKFIKLKIKIWKIKTIERSKLYECIYADCGKIFNDKGSYRKHALTHGEKQVLFEWFVQYIFFIYFYFI